MWLLVFDYLGTADILNDDLSVSTPIIVPTPKGIGGQRWEVMYFFIGSGAEYRMTNSNTGSEALRLPIFHLSDYYQWFETLYLEAAWDSYVTFSLTANYI